MAAKPTTPEPEPIERWTAQRMTVHRILGRSVLEICGFVTVYRILGRSVLEICGFGGEFGPSSDILVGRQISERAMRPV